MFSTSEIRSKPIGFSRFLVQLGSVVLLGLMVWAGLFAAAVWNEEQRPKPIIVAARSMLSVASTEY